MKALLDLTGCPTESIDFDEHSTHRSFTVFPFVLRRIFGGPALIPRSCGRGFWISRLILENFGGRLSFANMFGCRPKAFQWAVPLPEILSCGRHSQACGGLSCFLALTRVGHEVGLCGNHAYSVLDVRELYDQRFIGRERRCRFAQFGKPTI